MLSKTNLKRVLTVMPAVAAMVFILGITANSSEASIYADVLGYYEQGLHANTGYTDPYKAVSPDGSTRPSGLVSLGSWSDDPDYGTNDRLVGLLLGFSTSILNGVDEDLFVHGNAFSGWYEHGYVEVARETSGIGATGDGWIDETFYLIKPSNYDSLPNDPRTAAIPMSYMSQSDIGYADVIGDSEYMNIDWAIDDFGDPVSLLDIAYVRIRTVTDDSAGPFGWYTTEIDYVEALNGQVPIPGAVWLLGSGLLALIGIRRRSVS